MRLHLLCHGALWLAVMGLSFTSANAQTKQTPSVVVRIRTKTLEGKVQAINLSSMTLTVLANKEQQVLQCDSDCRYGDEEDGLESLAELKRGEQIYVKCAEINGQWKATRVARLKPEKAKAKPKAPPGSKK